MSAAPYLFYRYPFCHRPVQYRRGCPKRRLGADFSQNETRTYTVCRPASQIRFSLYRMTGTPQIWSPRALSGDDSRINSRPQPLSMIVGIGYTGWGTSKENQHNHPGFQGEFPLGASFPSLSRGERGCPRTEPCRSGCGFRCADIPNQALMPQGIPLSYHQEREKSVGDPPPNPRVTLAIHQPGQAA